MQHIRNIRWNFCLLLLLLCDLYVPISLPLPYTAGDEIRSARAMSFGTAKCHRLNRARPLDRAHEQTTTFAKQQLNSSTARQIQDTWLCRLSRPPSGARTREVGRMYADGLHLYED